MKNTVLPVEEVRRLRRVNGSLLNVEYGENGVVEIHFDTEDAEPPMERMRGLLAHRTPEHDHLAAPSRAGWELAEEGPGAEPANVVNLRFWPNHRREDRGETR